MSKFEEVFMKSQFDIENINTLPFRVLEKRDSKEVFERIKNFDDEVLNFFYFKHNWTTKNSQDLYYFWNGLTIEIYCLLNSLRRDYQANIREDNNILVNGQQINPDIVIRKKTENSRLKVLDSIEFKIRNTNLTNLDKKSFENKQLYYEKVQSEAFKDQFGLDEKKQSIFVIINNKSLEETMSRYKKRNGNLWIFDVYFDLKRLIQSESRHNPILQYKMNKQNNMKKVIDFLAEKHCLNGKKYFDNMQEGMKVFLKNLKENAGIEDDLELNPNLLETLTNNVSKIDQYFAMQSLYNSRKAFNNIKENIVKVEDLINDAYSYYLLLVDTINPDHMYDRSANRKLFDTHFGHKGKFLTDFPVHDLYLETDPNFVDKITPVITEFFKENNKIIENLENENTKFRRNVSSKNQDDFEINNARIDEIINRYQYKIVILLILLDKEFETEKQQLESLNRDFSVLKSILQKEATYIYDNNKEMTEKADKITKEIKELKLKVNAVLNRSQKGIKLNTVGYFEIEDSSKMNLGIGVKSRSVENKTGDELDKELKERLEGSFLEKKEEEKEPNKIRNLHQQKTFPREKLFADKISFRETNIIENIKNSINNWGDILDSYWPVLSDRNPYKNDIDKLANILLTKSEDILKKLPQNWIVKYNILKHLIFKQMSLIAPYSAGAKVSSKSFVGKQVDKLNMYIVCTAPPSSSSCGVTFMLTVHNKISEQECENGVYIPFGTKFLRISNGIRHKAHEHREFERIFSTIIGTRLITEHFEMGDSILFDSFFLRFNRELVKIFEHVNLIFKNAFCDHTLGKLDMKTEFEGLKLKDYRIMVVVKRVLEHYKQFISGFKKENLLASFNITEPIFGFTLKNLQGYMALIYAPSYFPKNDGFDGVRILFNFLIKDNQQHKDYENGPFNNEEILKNFFFLKNSFDENVDRMYKDDSNYHMTAFMPDLTFYGIFKMFRDSRPEEKTGRIPDKLMNENSSSSSTKEYLFNINEVAVKKILNISEIKTDLNTLIRESFDKAKQSYNSGEKVKLDKIINEICTKYLVEQKYKERLKNYIKKQLQRNKCFIMDVKLPESNMNAAVKVHEEYMSNKEVRDFLLSNNIYTLEELNNLRLEDMKVSDIILQALSNCWETKKYSQIIVILDTFPKLQRGFNKRLIYGMFNNPTGILFSNVDKSCEDLIKNSNVDLITKPGAKKYMLLEQMAKETIHNTLIGYFIVDQKRYGDKYAVHALMFNIYVYYLFNYFTESECKYCLEVLSMLLNRATVIPEKLAEKIKEIMNNSEKAEELKIRNPRMYNEVTDLMRGMITDDIKNDMKGLYPGTELNLYLKKSVGFVLGVFNVAGSAGSDAVAQSFISIANFFIRGLNMKGKTQSDDVLYCISAFLNILHFDKEWEVCAANFMKGLRVSSSGVDFVDNYLKPVDSGEVILILWALLLNCELANSQTFSPKKTAYSNLIGEMFQTLNVRDKNVSPFSKDASTLGNSMSFSSMVRDMSGMLGNIYSLFLIGADNQFINNVIMLANTLVRYFYRFELEDKEQNLFYLPVENGGIFYIYPDLIKINGFTGNYIRLLNIASKEPKMKILLSNCLNNDSIFQKNKRVVDNISLQSNNIVKKDVMNDSNDKNYAGSCFKEFRMRKTGNRYVKESLYTHFQSIINEVLYSIFLNLDVLKKIKVDMLELKLVLFRIVERKEISLSPLIRENIKTLLMTIDTTLINRDFLLRPIKSFINSIVKDLEAILRYALNFEHLPFLKQFKFLTKYLKENYQEGYLQSNPHIDRRHVVNYMNWKMVNTLKPEVKELINMKEDLYGIREMMTVGVKLTDAGYFIDENISFINMNIEIFAKELEYISNITIDNVEVVENNQNKELLFNWVEQKEQLGFSTFSYNVKDILTVIFQESVLTLPFHEITVIREKPYLRLDNFFIEEVSRVKELLNKYKMLNMGLVNSIDLISKLLTGEIKFKTFRTLNTRMVKVFDNSLNNFDMYRNIKANINETITTTSKIRITDLNNLNSVRDNNLAGGMIMKNQEIEIIKVDSEWVDREQLSRKILGAKKPNMRMYYTIDWVLDNKQRSFNFYEYTGKNKTHYILFTEQTFTMLTPKKKNTKVKIKSSYTDIERIEEEAFLISRSIMDKKIFTKFNDVHVCKNKRNQYNYNFILVNGKVTLVNDKNVGSLDLIINLKYDINKKFSKCEYKKKQTKKGKNITVDIFSPGKVGIFDRNIIKMVDMKTLDYFLYKKEIFKKNKKITEEINNTWDFLKKVEGSGINIKSTIEYQNILDLQKEKNKNTRNMVNTIRNKNRNRIKDLLDNSISENIIKIIETKKTRLRLFSNVKLISAWRSILSDDITYKYKKTGNFNNLFSYYAIADVAMPIIENNSAMNIVNFIEKIMFGTVTFESFSWEYVNKCLMFNRITKNHENIDEAINTIYENVKYTGFNNEFYSDFIFDTVKFEYIDNMEDFGEDDEYLSSDEEDDEGETFNKKDNQEIEFENSKVYNFEGKEMNYEEYIYNVQENPEVLLNEGFYPISYFSGLNKFTTDDYKNGFLVFLNNLKEENAYGYFMLETVNEFQVVIDNGLKLEDIEFLLDAENMNWITYIKTQVLIHNSRFKKKYLTLLYKLVLICKEVATGNPILKTEHFLVLYFSILVNFRDIIKTPIKPLQKLHFIVSVLEDMTMKVTEKKIIKKYYFNKLIKFPNLAKFSLKNSLYSSKALEKKEVIEIKRLWNRNNTDLIIRYLFKYDAGTLFKNVSLRKIELKNDTSYDFLQCLSAEYDKEKFILEKILNSEYKPLTHGVLLKGWEVLLDTKHPFYYEL